MIDRAAILGNGRSLEVSAALGLGNQRPHALAAGSSLDQSESPGAGSAQHATSTVADPQAALHDFSMDSAMRRHIKLVLEKTRGKVEGQGGAAELLAINPHTLRARMRKLKIKWAKFRQFD